MGPRLDPVLHERDDLGRGGTEHAGDELTSLISLSGPVQPAVSPETSYRSACHGGKSAKVAGEILLTPAVGRVEHLDNRRIKSVCRQPLDDHVEQRHIVTGPCRQADQETDTLRWNGITRSPEAKRTGGNKCGELLIRPRGIVPKLGLGGMTHE